ncbi:hypothetical protein [Salipiger sp.]|uniref:hypothetical protein n=1 Tax=Salipiger sp. TaxID=2078585 RepID=UPI003A96B358
MTLRKYPLPAILLALVLAFTSFEIAVARGTLPVAGQIVICSGQGFVTILLDAEGNPTDHVHICPDAAMAFTAPPVVPLAVPDVPAVWRRIADPLVEIRLAGRQGIPGRARGPPSATV